MLFRISHWLWTWRVPGLPWLIKVFNRLVFAVGLPPSAKVGRVVIFSYNGLGTVVHRQPEIGASAVVGTGVTFGGRAGLQGVPVIGDGAMLGSGAKVLGPVRIGRGASVGANAVVLADVPDYAVVVGVPARVVRIYRPSDLPNYGEFSKARRPEDERP